MADRLLTEREAFRAARQFLTQFNEREKSADLWLLIDSMVEEIWENPLVTSDPAQWYDWIDSVDRVLVDDGEPGVRAQLDIEHFASSARSYRRNVDSDLTVLIPSLVNDLTRLVAAAQLLQRGGLANGDPDVSPEPDPGAASTRREKLLVRLGPAATDSYRFIAHPALDGEYDEEPAVIGSIVDDFLEVYHGTSEGLDLFIEGSHSDAALAWRHSFESHWGVHAVNVLRVMHEWRS